MKKNYIFVHKHLFWMWINMSPINDWVYWSLMCTTLSISRCKRTFIFHWKVSANDGKTKQNEKRRRRKKQLVVEYWLWRNVMLFQICRGNKYSKNFNNFGACHVVFHFFLHIYSCWSIDFVFFSLSLPKLLLLYVTSGVFRGDREFLVKNRFLKKIRSSSWNISSWIYQNLMVLISSEMYWNCATVSPVPYDHIGSFLLISLCHSHSNKNAEENKTFIGYFASWMQIKYS